MNTKIFTSLLANPQQLNDQQLAELQSVLDAYPYFQSARALQLKGLKNKNSFRYNDALKLAAAHTADRDILFQYITSDAFVQNEISEAILQHDASVYEIEVEAENVSEQTALELDTQIKAELKKAEAILNPMLFERKDKAPAPGPQKNLPENPSATEINPKKETTLKVDTPLAFEKGDTHSFSEWLKLTKAEPIDRSKSSSRDAASSQIQSTDLEKKLELIDRFIQEKPKLEVAATNSKQPDLSEPYTQTPNALMTETLAKVYLQQKNYQKAIKAYEILILKNPEKSGFFADQIRAIKKLNTKEES